MWGNTYSNLLDGAHDKKLIAPKLVAEYSGNNERSAHDGRKGSMGVGTPAEMDTFGAHSARDGTHKTMGSCVRRVYMMCLGILGFCSVGLSLAE